MIPTTKTKLQAIGSAAHVEFNKIIASAINKITKRAHGADMSKWNDFWLPPKNIPLQIDFVIQRIGYGQRADERLNELHAQIQHVPIRGGYHYLSSAVDVEMQIDTFLERVTKLGGYQFFACDVEKAYNKKSAGFARDAKMFIDVVAQETGKRVLLYTNPAIYKTWLLPYGDWMRNYPLWIAQYWWLPSPDKNPGLKGTQRTDWHFYQYTEHGDGTAYGAGSKQLDLNVFNGTVEELNAWVGIKSQDEVPTEPLPPEEQDDCAEDLERGIQIGRKEIKDKVQNVLNDN